MKTPPYFFISILLTFLLLTGCNSNSDDYISKYCPGSCTVIKGRLTTANGTKPLANVPLAINWHWDGYLSGSSLHKKAIAKTDADGNYELRFLIRDDELVEGYFVVESALDVSRYVYCRADLLNLRFHNLKRDTTLLMNYEIPEKAFLKFELSNLAAIKAEDEFTTFFTYYFGEEGQERCSNNIPWHNSTRDSFIVEVAADQPFFLEQVKLKDGVETKERTTLQLKPGETEVVALNF